MEKKRLLSRFNLRSMLLSYNSVVILLLLLIFGTFFVGKFTSNISTIIYEASIYGFIAVGLSVVMVTGNIDLSVGFQAALGAVVTVFVLNATGSLILAVLAVLVVSALTGAINGLAVTWVGISPLIATIATNYIYKGIVYYFTKDGSYSPDGKLRDVLRSSVAGTSLFGQQVLTLTVIIIVLALAVLFFIMRKTRFGVSMYIAGDNPEAGSLSGINIRRTNFLAYVICGVCCGVAGLFLASNSGAAIYTQGEGRDVFAISACVIGGIKMAGGKGTMVNVLLGVLIMRIISTGMNLMLVPSSWVDFVSGALLVGVLIIDKVTSPKEV